MNAQEQESIDHDRERIRRMTNLDLWKKLIEMLNTREHLEIYLLESEFEWRLRKIGFLPAPPPREERATDDGSSGAG